MRLDLVSAGSRRQVEESMAVNIGPELMAKLKQRYQAGELSRHQYEIELTKLEEKIARGHAIRRPLWEHALKWTMVLVLIGMGVAMIVLFQNWMIWIMALGQFALAIYMAVTP